MESSEVQEWSDLIDTVAKYTASDYPDVDWEDLSQFLWLKVLQSGDLDVNDKNVRSTIRYAARKEAGRQRNEHLTISVQYAYRTSDVRKLMEFYFDSDRWLEAPVPEDAESELGMVQLEMMADISRAFEKLSINYKGILARKYWLNDELDTNERKLLSRAMARLAELMNSYLPKNDEVGRKVLTNLAAAALIQDEYGS